MGLREDVNIEDVGWGFSRTDLLFSDLIMYSQVLSDKFLLNVGCRTPKEWSIVFNLSYETL